MDKEPRWKREAARVRRGAPAWLDVDRLPWWLFALLGVGFVARGVYLLLAAGTSEWDRIAAVGLLLLVAPSQFLVAQQRRRGEPLRSSRREQ